MSSWGTLYGLKLVPLSIHPWTSYGSTARHLIIGSIPMFQGHLHPWYLIRSPSGWTHSALEMMSQPPYQPWSVSAFVMLWSCVAISLVSTKHVMCSRVIQLVLRRNRPTLSSCWIDDDGETKGLMYYWTDCSPFSTSQKGIHGTNLTEMKHRQTPTIPTTIKYDPPTCTIYRKLGSLSLPITIEPPDRMKDSGENNHTNPAENQNRSRARKQYLSLIDRIRSFIVKSTGIAPMHPDRTHSRRENFRRITPFNGPKDQLSDPSSVPSQSLV